MARPVSEDEWKRFLASRGFDIPRGRLVRPDGEADDIEALTAGLTAPFAVKAVGATIVHKTELGAVRLGVAARAVATEMNAMRAALAERGIVPDGFLVEEMVDPGIELLLGVATDRVFGRLMAFGTGGARVEALGEVHFFALPLRAIDVETLLASVPWLVATLQRTGERGLGALRDALRRFGGPGGVALDPAIDTLEINPLIVTARAAIAADARGALA